MDRQLSQDDELQILRAFCREATLTGRDSGIYRLNLLLAGRGDLRDTGLPERVAALREEDQEVLREVAVLCIDSAIAGFGRMLTSAGPPDFVACTEIDGEWVALDEVFADLFSGEYLGEAPEISVYDPDGRRK